MHFLGIYKNLFQRKTHTFEYNYRRSFIKLKILYLICNNKSLLHKVSYIWDKNHIFLVRIIFIPMFLVTVG